MTTQNPMSRAYLTRSAILSACLLLCLLRSTAYAHDTGGLTWPVLREGQQVERIILHIELFPYDGEQMCDFMANDTRPCRQIKVRRVIKYKLEPANALNRKDFLMDYMNEGMPVK